MGPMRRRGPSLVLVGIIDGFLVTLVILRLSATRVLLVEQSSESVADRFEFSIEHEILRLHLCTRAPRHEPPPRVDLSGTHRPPVRESSRTGTTSHLREG